MNTKLLNELFDFLFGNQNTLLSFALSLVTVLIAWLNFKRVPCIPIYMRRLESVVVPLFCISEPFMMKNASLPTSETLNSIQQLLSDNVLLAGGKLYQFCNIVQSPHRFPYFCKILNQQYDLLCKKCGIPLRPSAYRLRCYQPKYAAFSILKIILHAIVYTAFSFASLFLLIAIVSLLATGKYQYALSTLPILILLFCAAFASHPKS